MNNQGREIKKLPARKVAQARELSALTRELSHCCIEKEERICRSFDLHSADGRLLAAMLNEQITTSSGLAARLGIGNSRITPIIDRLVAKGLVARTGFQSDRRVRTVELTEQGRAIAIQMRDFETELHLKLLGYIPSTERAGLLTTLHHLKNAMDEVKDSILIR